MEFNFKVDLENYECYECGNGARSMVDDILDRAVETILRETQTSYNDYGGIINTKLSRIADQISKDLLDQFTNRKQDIMTTITNNVVGSVTDKIERSRSVKELVKSYDTDTDSVMKKNINKMIKESVKEQVKSLIRF